MDIKKWHRKKVIEEMTLQGNQYTKQERFFREFWEAMRNSFTEENNVSSATFVLQRFMSVLPLKTISKEAIINTIEDAYSGKLRL